MVDVPQKAGGTGSGQYIVKKKRRRKVSYFKNNLFWCGIILILTLIFGAIIGFYSHFFDDYFKSEEVKLTVSEQDISK
jgi:hypothetical protein